MTDRADPPSGGRAIDSTTASTAGLATSSGTVPRLAFVLLVLAYAAVVVVLAWRLAAAYNHRYPDLRVGDDLVIADSPFFRLAGLGLEERGVLGKLRVAAVDGFPVTDRRQFLARLSGRPCADLEIERIPPDPSRAAISLVWVEVSGLQQLRVGEDMHLDAGVDCFSGRHSERVIAIAGRPVASASELAAVLDRWRSARLTLVLESPIGRRTVLIRVIDWSTAVAILVGAVVIGATGLIVFRLRPYGRSAWGLLLFAFVMGLFGCVRALPHVYRSPFEQALFLVLQCAMPSACAVLLVTFGPLRNVVHRAARFAAIALLFGAALLALDWIVAREEAAVGVLTMPLFLTWALSLVLLLAVACTGDWMLRARGVTLAPTDLDRARVTRWAILLSSGPLTIYTLLLPMFLMQAHFGGARPWVELSVCIFPILVGYAIVRHNALELHELAVEGVILTTLIAGAAGVTALLSALVLPFLQSRIPGGDRFLLPLALALIVLAAGPLHRVLRVRLSHWLARRSRSSDDVVVTLGVDSLLELPALERAREIAMRAQRILAASGITIWQRYPQDGWTLAAMTADRPRPQAEACLPLLTEAESGRMLFLDDALERVLLPHRKALLRAFRELDAVAAFPLQRRGGVFGVLTVGSRREGADAKPYGHNYSARELRQMRELARQAADCLAFSNDEDSTPVPARVSRRRQRVASYDIDQVIGSGATSMVYLGSSGGRQVAIKIPLPSVRANERLLDRFMRESRVLSLLDDRHVLPIFEVGWADDDPFVAMEYCRQGTLRDVLRARGRMSEEESLRTVVQIASGLESGLRKGIIHRDVKPANVFKSDAGWYKVGDFGLARFLDETTVTGESSFLGTAAYVAPEVARGDRAGWFADQYSLGICLFEMLVGERPYFSAHPAQALAQHLYQPMPDIRSRRPDVSPETAALLGRMTAKEPAARFHTWGEVIDSAGGGGE